MAITGGFGTLIDLVTGRPRRWYMRADGIRRWVSNDQPCAASNESDLWRCTECGRIGSVGRCCGDETREPVTRWQPPDLRRRLIVEDFDTGEVKRTVIDMHATPRIDSYRVVIDGKPQAGRLGWSRILDRVRLAMPRKCSPRWIGE